MVLIGGNHERQVHRMARVSVPLRGLWFLSCIQEGGGGVPIKGEFLSPRGYYVSLRRNPCVTSSQFGSCFRPLAGIMVLILYQRGRGTISHYGAVSVPLRGLWFLSEYPHIDCFLGNKVVSVPLRGLWFLSTWVEEYKAEIREWCFRPLAGIMVLIPITSNIYRGK